MTELYHRHKESLPHNLNVSFASAVAAVIVFASAATTALAVAAKNIVIVHGAWVPKSPLAAAIGYTLRNWVALTRYAEDGRLKIDNNGAEQALRPMRSHHGSRPRPVRPGSILRRRSPREVRALGPVDDFLSGQTQQRRINP